MHPELGHLRARLEGKPSNWNLETEQNFCGYSHVGCFESIIAIPALARRVNVKEMLEGSAYEGERKFVAICISQICEITTLAFAPQKILISGYINPLILKDVRDIFRANLRGYPSYHERHAHDFILKSRHPPTKIAAFGAAILAQQNYAK